MHSEQIQSLRELGILHTTDNIPTTERHYTENSVLNSLKKMYSLLLTTPHLSEKLILQLTSKIIAQAASESHYLLKKIFGILEQTWTQENNQVSRFCHSLKADKISKGGREQAHMHMQIPKI